MQANKETHEEMVGVLTAMSIVSKRLARRLLELEKGEEENEQNQTSTRCGGGSTKSCR